MSIIVRLFAGMAVVIGCLVMGMHSELKASEGAGLKQSEEYRIGLMVKEVAAAIQAPEKEGSMETIVKAGTDSRYYVMIRGWLKESLHATQSQLDAVRKPGQKSRLERKVAFLKLAIRRIDLE